MDADIAVFGETGNLSVRQLLRARNDDWRWSSAPFFLRTGKRLLLEEMEAGLAAQREQGLSRRERVSLPVSGATHRHRFSAGPGNDRCPGNASTEYIPDRSRSES